MADMQPVDRQAALYAALAKAQGAMKNPERNRTVTVRSERGNYTFDYATLDNIIDTARKALSDNGIALIQCLERDPAGNAIMVTKLLHKDGGAIINEMPIDLPKPKKRVGRNGEEYFEDPRIQEMGSVITYARRYAICAILNIAAEEDDDGTSGQDRDVKPRGNQDPEGSREQGTDLRASYRRIRDKITKAKSALELADVLLAEKDALLELKKGAEKGYEEIMKIKEDRVLEFQAAQEK